MGLRELLRRVDGLLLPPLGRGVRWLQAGTGRRRVIASTALIGCAALVVAAVWSTDRPTRPVDGSQSGPVVRVGVNDGASIPGYVDASQRELATLGTGSAQPTWALVSLSAYIDPAAVVKVAKGLVVVRVYSRVPLPRAQTEIVQLNVAELPADLIAEMDRAAAAKDADAANYASLAAKLSGDTTQEKDQREIYQTSQRLAAAEAEQYRKHCACLYGLVVRAVPADLVALSRLPLVRSVDPAPEVTSFERAVFLPALPEQFGIAGPVDSDLSDPRPPVGVPPASKSPR